MRNILILAMFAATLAHAASNDYEEVRELALDAGGVAALHIEAGAGSLEITGVPRTDRIRVAALIRVPDTDADKAKAVLDEHMVLSLLRKGDAAELKSYFDGGSRMFRDSPSIGLEVQLPEGMSLHVEDRSGSIIVRNVAGDIELDDGSGSIEMTKVGGNLQIEDGSGSISITDAGGDLSIVDGSGSITVRGVQGSVSIDDGSGGIEVADVAGDALILEAGSGSVKIRDVQGTVDHDD
ncbi:MAG: hypothetical protein WDZ50_01920 [Woeseia sp.]